MLGQTPARVGERGERGEGAGENGEATVAIESRHEQNEQPFQSAPFGQPPWENHAHFR